jgi:hypothetical protein
VVGMSLGTATTPGAGARNDGSGAHHGRRRSRTCAHLDVRHATEVPFWAHPPSGRPPGPPLLVGGKGLGQLSPIN